MGLKPIQVSIPQLCVCVSVCLFVCVCEWACERERVHESRKIQLVNSEFPPSLFKHIYRSAHNLCVLCAYFLLQTVIPLDWTLGRPFWTILPLDTNTLDYRKAEFWIIFFSLFYFIFLIWCSGGKWIWIHPFISLFQWKKVVTIHNVFVCLKKSGELLTLLEQLN